MIGVDIGKPGGDHTAVALLCTCGRIHSRTWPAGTEPGAVAFNCECGQKFLFDTASGLCT